MTNFKIHNADTAPHLAQPVLKHIESSLGYIPNLMGTIANSGIAMQAMANLNEAVSKTGFDATEQEVIQIAASVVNESGYCVAGHTVFSERANLPADVIEAARNGGPIADGKLEALRRFTETLMRRRGHVTAGDIDGFIYAGYSKEQFIELVVVVATKVVTNFVSVAARIPLDETFLPHAWVKPSKDGAAPEGGDAELQSSIFA